MQQITPEQIKKLFPNASQSTLNRNQAQSRAVGAVDKPEPERVSARSLDPKRKVCKGGKAVVAVSLIRFGRRELDGDNLSGSFKNLRDAIADSLGVDDKDPRVRWQYGQVETNGETGTLVRIEVL